MSTANAGTFLLTLVHERVYVCAIQKFCLILLYLYFQLNNRLNASKEEKRKRINYIGIGVSDEAQKVFNSIVKT